AGEGRALERPLGDAAVDRLLAAGAAGVLHAPAVGDWPEERDVGLQAQVGEVVERTPGGVTAVQRVHAVQGSASAPGHEIPHTGSFLRARTTESVHRPRARLAAVA